MIRINEIKFSLDEPFTHERLVKKLAQKAKVKTEDVQSVDIVRESIDARKGIQLTYTVDAVIRNEKHYRHLKDKQAPAPHRAVHETLTAEQRRKIEAGSSPVVIGLGPAGLFCALELARAGARPMVVEMGEPVNRRDKSVETFWETGVLNPKSNVQFGEGGAGTYSDGKLTTRIKDKRVETVLKELIAAGAQPEIAYKQKPHIGTDVLKHVVVNLRETIIALGGKVYFDAEVTDLLVDPDRGCVTGVVVNGTERIEADAVVAATGHSARAFYKCLYDKHLILTPKPFAVGVRIEHPQEVIDKAQYGRHYKHPKLGAAEYKLSYRATNGRSVYSFCMCPGGKVVASASEMGRLVVNGMSYSKRDLYNANSAMLVTVEPEDFPSAHPLAGIEFQRAIEARAYAVAGDYKAPIQTVGAFLGSDALTDEPSFEQLVPTYRPGTVEAELAELFPESVVSALKEAIPYFGQKIAGFDDARALMTAPETRSSAPVRIERLPDTYEATTLKGFYPCGEGAGYAGGITSAAVDGIKVAEAILLKWMC